MSDFLARFSFREKAIVAFAIIILLVLTVHAFVVEPYQLRLQTAKSEIDQYQADLEWMRSITPQLMPVEASQTTVSIDGSLANFVDQTVRQQGLSEQLSQISPVDDDVIRMRFSGVNFNRLVTFVALIYSSGLEVRDIRITPSESPGFVDSNLILFRP